MPSAPRHDRQLRRILRATGVDLRDAEKRGELSVQTLEAMACEGTLRALYVRQGVGARSYRPVGLLLCDSCGAIMPRNPQLD